MKQLPAFPEMPQVIGLKDATGDVTQSWSRLSEQNLAADKWSLCQG